MGREFAAKREAFERRSIPMLLHQNLSSAGSLCANHRCARPIAPKRR